MRSVKSIIAGSLFIIISILLMQLAYIFIAVAYNAMAKDYPFLNYISGSFRYLIGIPVFVVTMFLGGYITANIANMKTSIKVWLHCIVVGLLTTGGMMYSALENTNITITGIVVFILALGATTAGGLYWQKHNRINQT